LIPTKIQLTLKELKIKNCLLDFYLEVSFIFSILSGGKLTLSTNYLTMKSDYVTVESGGLIDSSGFGYSAGSGPGSGSGSIGGSHASPGGRASSGTQYGSIYWPDKPGSGGGYGAGGGWLYIVTGGHMIVEGTIRANGIGSLSSSSGGGSGGAIILKSLFLKGYGTIECHGGLCSTPGWFPAVLISGHITLVKTLSYPLRKSNFLRTWFSCK